MGGSPILPCVLSLAAKRTSADMSDFSDSAAQKSAFLHDRAVTLLLDQAPIIRCAEAGAGADPWAIMLQECDLFVGVLPLVAKTGAGPNHRVTLQGPCH